MKDLEYERKDVESQIRKVQEGYYKENKITEKDYHNEFLELNERLAEIEDERTTSYIQNRELPKEGIPVLKQKKGILGRMMQHRERKKLEEERLLKQKIDEILAKFGNENGGKN